MLRIGLGYDVHAFAEDRKLILGGVEIDPAARVVPGAPLGRRRIHDLLSGHVEVKGEAAAGAGEIEEGSGDGIIANRRPGVPPLAPQLSAGQQHSRFG